MTAELKSFREPLGARKQPRGEFVRALGATLSCLLRLKESLEDQEGHDENTLQAMKLLVETFSRDKDRKSVV